MMDKIQIEETEGIPIKDVPYFSEKKWLSPLNFMEEVVGSGLSKRKVTIHDVTLRDGEQTPGVVWKEDERVLLAQAFDEIGIHRIEVGMPIISEDIRRATKRLTSMSHLKAEIEPLARAHMDDINICIDCGVKSVGIEICLNPYTLRYAMDLSFDQALERIVNTIHYARKNGMRTNFHGWDSGRTTLDYLRRAYSRIIKEAQPDSITVYDTFGDVTPMAVLFLFRKLKEWFPETSFEFHTHNDFGFSNGSTLAAVMGGADCVHCAFNGLGERTGNTPTEEIVTALELLFGIKTGIKLSGLKRVSRLVEEISKVKVHPNKPIVGDRIFDVESGLVVDIIEKFRPLGVRSVWGTYVPELVGAKPLNIILGKGAGKANVQHYLEKYGVSLDKDALNDLTQQIKDLGRIKKGNVTEEEFMILVNQIKKVR
jgi:isopropylmalate/homocitrate/citramalate synthase